MAEDAQTPPDLRIAKSDPEIAKRDPGIRVALDRQGRLELYEGDARIAW